MCHSICDLTSFASLYYCSSCFLLWFGNTHRMTNTLLSVVCAVLSVNVDTIFCFCWMWTNTTWIVTRLQCPLPFIPDHFNFYKQWADLHSINKLVSDDHANFLHNHNTMYTHSPLSVRLYIPIREYGMHTQHNSCAMLGCHKLLAALSLIHI